MMTLRLDPELHPGARLHLATFAGSARWEPRCNYLNTVHHDEHGWCEVPDWRGVSRRVVLQSFDAVPDGLVVCLHCVDRWEYDQDRLVTFLRRMGVTSPWVWR